MTKQERDKIHAVKLKERYRNDPEYRQRCLDNAKEYHRVNRDSAAYRKLTRLRKQLWWWREYVAEHKRKISKLNEKIKNGERRKELLEIAWGMERAKRKGKQRCQAA